MDKTQKQCSYYESLFLGFGLTFMLVLGYFNLLVTYWLRDITVDVSVLNTSLLILLSGFAPTILWIITIHRGFSKITISEYGLKRSLFRVFGKRNIEWCEVVDIRVIHLVESRIYFSRVNIDNMVHRKIVNHKDIVHLPFSLELCKKIQSISPIKLVYIEELLAK